MKQAIKVLVIIFLSLSALLGIILFFVWACQKVESTTPEYQPVTSITPYESCRADNKEKILEAYQKCVADAQGNNVRCENSAIRIFCGY